MHCCVNSPHILAAWPRLCLPCQTKHTAHSGITANRIDRGHHQITMPGAAAAASTGNSLLRIAHACETLLAGFNSGKAAAVRSCLVSRQHAESLVQEAERPVAATGAGTPTTTTTAVGGEHNNTHQQQRQQQRGASDGLLSVRGTH